MAQNKKSTDVYRLTLIALMSAFAFVSNYLSIQIGDVSRIHFGNVLCVLSGLLLGGPAGGMAAGLGAFFYDLTNPLYASEAFITFFMKFALGFTAGTISHLPNAQSNRTVYNAVAGVAGSLVYVALYLAKNFIKEYYIIKNPIETVMVKMITKGTTSLLNAGIAVVFALIFFPVFNKILTRSGFNKMHAG